MEVEGEVFSFDIFRAMKHPMESEEVYALDAGRPSPRSSIRTKNRSFRTHTQWSRELI
ncbi:unnamed protein product [Rhodiola kirilowii]